ncbi:hypothetical protein B7486_12960 [cyanobacterium TDX16]|nr:hypothetical protein B7486_12960 [cyanobacterium TDX16]
MSDTGNSIDATQWDLLPMEPEPAPSAPIDSRPIELSRPRRDRISRTLGRVAGWFTGKVKRWNAPGTLAHELAATIERSNDAE